MKYINIFIFIYSAVQKFGVAMIFFFFFFFFFFKSLILKSFDQKYSDIVKLIFQHYASQQTFLIIISDENFCAA